MRGRSPKTMLAAAGAVAAAVLLAAQPAAPPSKPDGLAALAFMAGDWQGDAGGGAFSQEVWAAPVGDCMMGMWRLVAGGKVELFESLSITQEASGPVMRMRHFGRDGVGWEERDKPVALPLVRSADGLAVFAGPGRSGTLRITYRRTGEDAMAVAVEKSDGREEFTFRRVSRWRGDRRQ